MEDNLERGGRRGNRRVGAAKRQAKYVVSSLIIGAAARADRDKRGRRSKVRSPGANDRCCAVRTSISALARPRRSAGPVSTGDPGRNPPPSVTAANHVQHRLAFLLFDNFERPLQRR